MLGKNVVIFLGIVASVVINNAEGQSGNAEVNVGQDSGVAVDIGLNGNDNVHVAAKEHQNVDAELSGPGNIHINSDQQQNVDLDTSQEEPEDEHPNTEGHRKNVGVNVAHDSGVAVDTGLNGNDNVHVAAKEHQNVDAGLSGSGNIHVNSDQQQNVHLDTSQKKSDSQELSGAEHEPKEKDAHPNAEGHLHNVEVKVAQHSGVAVDTGLNGKDNVHVAAKEHQNVDTELSGSGNIHVNSDQQHNVDVNTSQNSKSESAQSKPAAEKPPATKQPHTEEPHNEKPPSAKDEPKVKSPDQKGVHASVGGHQQIGVNVHTGVGVAGHGQVGVNGNVSANIHDKDGQPNPDGPEKPAEHPPADNKGKWEHENVEHSGDLGGGVKIGGGLPGSGHGQIGGDLDHKVNIPGKHGYTNPGGPEEPSEHPPPANSEEWKHEEGKWDHANVGHNGNLGGGVKIGGGLSGLGHGHHGGDLDHKLNIHGKHGWANPDGPEKPGEHPPHATPIDWKHEEGKWDHPKVGHNGNLGGGVKIGGGLSGLGHGHHGGDLDHKLNIHGKHGWGHLGGPEKPGEHPPHANPIDWKHEKGKWDHADVGHNGNLGGGVKIGGHGHHGGDLDHILNIHGKHGWANPGGPEKSGEYPPHATIDWKHEKGKWEHPIIGHNGHLGAGLKIGVGLSGSGHGHHVGDLDHTGKHGWANPGGPEKPSEHPPLANPIDWKHDKGKWEHPNVAHNGHLGGGVEIGGHGHHGGDLDHKLNIHGKHGWANPGGPEKPSEHPPRVNPMEWKHEGGNGHQGGGVKVHAGSSASTYGQIGGDLGHKVKANLSINIHGKPGPVNPGGPGKPHGHPPSSNPKGWRPHKPGGAHSPHPVGKGHPGVSVPISRPPVPHAHGHPPPNVANPYPQGPPAHSVPHIPKEPGSLSVGGSASAQYSQTIHGGETGSCYSPFNMPGAEHHISHGGFQVPGGDLTILSAPGGSPCSEIISKCKCKYVCKH